MRTNSVNVSSWKACTHTRGYDPRELFISILFMYREGMKKVKTRKRFQPFLNTALKKKTML